ncbi:hypothetical protein Cabys_4038 [Caldithrix abyssi DSM 13497]|uniref:Uncharacterized protein n=1 Tax=Caldithrix abyssi DSM 13497 TaxID=880073 RepID=A0A1J1CDM9_CALAY|nr:hypothetical protein Cabys_4038 [Caldithrix abyssi DSM 13497]
MFWLSSPITVAGQWRIFTALPVTERVLFVSKERRFNIIRLRLKSNFFYRFSFFKGKEKLSFKLESTIKKGSEKAEPENA